LIVTINFYSETKTNPKGKSRNIPMEKKLGRQPKAENEPWLHWAKPRTHYNSGSDHKG